MKTNGDFDFESIVTSAPGEVTLEIKGTPELKLDRAICADLVRAMLRAYPGLVEKVISQDSNPLLHADCVQVVSLDPATGHIVASPLEATAAEKPTLQT